MSTVPPAAVDLSDGRSFGGGFPHDFFTWLRAEAPLWWHAPTATTPDGEGFWVLSRYADVDAVIMDAASFSSDTGGDRVGGGTAIKDEPTAGKVLNHTDDPYHKRLRALVNKGFTVRAVAALEDELRRRCRALLDALDAGEELDFAHRVSREIPTQAICIVLGVPEGDRERLVDLVDAGIETPSDSVIAAEQARELRRYAQALIETKRAQPDAAIFSTIVHAELADGVRLNDAELRSFFALLFPAGAETTTRAISGGLLALIENPAAWARLCAEPTLARGAVEEIVRWTTPSVYKRRTATRDLELLGQPIRAGEKVTFWEMSANRDERVFADPFRFDITRSPNKHLGFGAGVHFCLGAALARLEIKVMLEELVARGLDFELAGQPQWMPNNRLFGLKALPVRAIAR
ncbi:MAG: cytochrome P450 [Gammaproteobacteria bacterium]|nr:cytochrome P450 [Gammaproteobacteria bacterium]MCP5200346.1 cytochrome P450 [Gammaproteobacteria bacterium]